MRREDHFENCPKCQAEIIHVNYEKLKIEYCPNCKGMFFDYKELEGKNISVMESTFPRERKGKKILDGMETSCPKCHTKMAKKKYLNPASPRLDICPSCHGVWFDHGELPRFRKSLDHPFQKAVALQLKFECSNCGILLEKDYEQLSGNIARCPRCNELLSFEGVGEVLVPKWPKEEKIFLISLITGIVILFFIFRFFIFGNTTHALIAAGCLGGVGLVIILRALIFGKFVSKLGPKVRDFNL